jgi:hypothetical protein
MLTERDRSRLDALIEIVKNANPLAARVDTLTDDQREWYDGWKARLDRFIEQHPDGEAYEMYLKGFGPRLPHTIGVVLFGEAPRILTSDDDRRAAEIYQRYCNVNL